ncbi:accessory factor associated with RNA polymerase II, partial [Coemansia sp. IMI 209127]
MSLTSTSDPLELLRQYTMQKKGVELLGSDGNLTKDLLQAVTVRFGEDASFPRDTPTQFLRSNSESDQYMLSALLHFLAHRNQSFYEYMKTTNALGLQTVSFGDRGNLLDYLTGKTSDVGASKAGASSAGTAVAGTAGDKHDGDVDAEGRRVRTRTSATDSTSAGAAGDRLSSGAAAPVPGGSDSARDIMRRERVLMTTSTALSSNNSFANVTDLVKELFPSKGDAKGGSSKSAGPGSSAATAAPENATPAKPAHRKAGRAKRRDPIIVVPAATTAMLN